VPADTVGLVDGSMAGVLIDCDTCVMRRTSACRDCVMTFLLDADERDATHAVVIDVDEQRALRLFASRGLVPSLRHQRAG
jgi:hypothetical protein